MHGFDILLLRSIEYLTMLKLIKTLIQPCGQISLDHEVPDNLLPFQGNPITDGASLHTILAFDALLWKKNVEKNVPQNFYKKRKESLWHVHEVVAWRVLLLGEKKFCISILVAPSIK